MPVLPLLYALVILAIGDLRPEHVLFGLGCLALGYAGPRSKAFLVDVSPYILVAICYDMVRYARVALVTEGRVLGCELRTLELALFSVAPGVTPQDWFALHHSPFWDVVFALPYAFFAYAALGYAAYLYFVDRPRMRHYLWAFALANLISFVVWLALPAAPPWYLRQHGCAIDLTALPSPAGLSRVDALLGVDYFKTFYSRAASVFGALPSMHCAYPMLGLLTARRVATWRTWPIHVLYVITMFAASVYLDHHWIIDGRLRPRVRLGAGSVRGRRHRPLPPSQSGRSPIHVTLRVRRGVSSLRRRRTFAAVRRALSGGKQRFGMRLVHYSVQSNHLHLLLEVADRRSLSRGMQGLGVRLAKAVNRALGRAGTVFAERYHARRLKTALDVWRVLHYVLNNVRRHAAGRSFPKDWLDPCSSAPYFDGWHGRAPPRQRDDATVPARSELLSGAWRAYGLLEAR